jgi:hypothetical protein
MPYKALASLKRLANLGAEVVDIAPLDGDQLALAIASDPVKLQVFPYAGSAGRVTNVSLDEGSAGALLNKQVAVVKSGDDLWALLDIQHTPKMEQVGRDIRSLYACPKGGTALAIGWDGQGAALAFQNNEVGGRQFVVRGQLRAACLTADTTYVIADASAGGQLRGHPGSTPETGASTRADLPPAAASYDRLAGGHQLCAVSRRGADAVCVVVREGAAALTVKMLHVDTVADVAVIDASLFVLGSDGTLRLYNSDAIKQASEGGSPTPTAELALGGGGQPMRLLATSKGGARLWAGFKGGDVVRCEAVKGGLDF